MPEDKSPTSWKRQRREGEEPGSLLMSSAAELTILRLPYCLLPDFLLQRRISKSSFLPLPLLSFHVVESVLSNTIRSILTETEKGLD